MSIRRYIDEMTSKRARQLMVLCPTQEVPLGSCAALIDEAGEAHPLLPYVGAGNYTSAGALLRLPSSLDVAQSVVLEWQSRNFEGRATVEGTLNHLRKELDEVLSAANEGSIAGIAAEVADLFVLLTQLAALLNVDIGEATIEKLGVLLQRDYSGEPDADGCITHKKDNADE
jgi:NTP pyrophosphatase (non-canonical NTP hydrolase)